MEGLISEQKRRTAVFWLMLIRGNFAIILGLVLLFYPERTLPVLVNFMGGFWLISGLMTVRWTIEGSRSRGLPLAAGMIGVLTGVITLLSNFLPEFASDIVLVSILGLVILFTGLMHAIGGFRGGVDESRTWSLESFLLGLFEVVLGVLLITNPLTRDSFLYLAATIWAFLGGVILIGDSLRLRAQTRNSEAKEPL